MVYFVVQCPLKLKQTTPYLPPNFLCLTMLLVLVFTTASPTHVNIDEYHTRGIHETNLIHGLYVVDI